MIIKTTHDKEVNCNLVDLFTYLLISYILAKNCETKLNCVSTDFLRPCVR